MEPYDFDVELSNVKPEKARTMLDQTIRLDYAGPNGLVRGRVDLIVTTPTKPGLKPIYKAVTIDDGIIFGQANGFDPAFILFKMFHHRGHFKAFEQSLLSAFLTTNVTQLDPQRLAQGDTYGAAINQPFSVGEGYEKVRVDNRAVFRECGVYITAKNTVRIDLEDTQHDIHHFEGDTLYKALEQARPFVKQAIDTYTASKKDRHV